ncbi:hypothetical protein L198_04331 [Cryptococcus wingfieldii CBS 7118]|uniref:Mediator of RNA polymerase II transcription subunit 5 n=1 Tax=Cryptococcus wingfieldii CBS 7118 TaxID=1295528 RepID=A0A1E3J4E6_9TREE|nr:hypothetical protein L198_04331 [Cryptococcus wingfieldii CBS 7118]ODN95713.1 hypothetical protein L198_04331 [Cryptococcus wingfieldii CBS 7118]
MANDLPPTAHALVSRAFAIAAPPLKLSKTLKSSVKRGELTEDQLSAALLDFLIPSSPSLVLSYLSQLLSSSTITARSLCISLLSRISERDLPPISSLIPISDIIINNFTGFTDLLLPAVLGGPASDYVESSSAGPSSLGQSRETSSLSVMLPLLRLAATPSPPSAIVSLVARLLSVLAPFPAPSLDVGLEAGQLLPLLPEEISNPLRVSLGGLMEDLVQGSASETAAQPQTVLMAGQGTSAAPALPLKEVAALLLEQTHSSFRYSRTPLPSESQATVTPPAPHIRLLRLGQSACPVAGDFLFALVEISIERVLNGPSGDRPHAVGTGDNVRDFGWAVEGLPKLLKWWKMQSTDGEFEKWMFPSDASSLLASAIARLLPAMQAFSEALLQTYSSIVSAAEEEEESSGFTPPDGWSVLPLQDTLIASLVHEDIINSGEALAILPGVTIASSRNGPSLLERMGSESRHHIKPLAFIISYACGSASPASHEFIQTIRAIPQTPPAEDILIYMSSQSFFFSSLISQSSPTSLLDLMEQRLLTAYAELDEYTRSEDPQGCLTRFGEGVVLIESFAREFDLDLPPLLHRARRAFGYGSLTPTHQDCVNGWVKAIFGSDGIEDQILLATPPEDLAVLVPTLIQQAIAAVTCGQMDLETLHSGLSYFSQPLLSWCLGGVIAWLCDEIFRLGPLSALHLVVLQSLALGHACPDQLLRVNDQALFDVIRPSNDLQDVINSSGFKAEDLRTKLTSLGVTAPDSRQDLSLDVALETISHFPLSAPLWPCSFIIALRAKLSTYGGRTAAISSILSKTFSSANAPSEAPIIAGQWYSPLVPILLAIDVDGKGPLAADLPHWIHSCIDRADLADSDRRKLGALVKDSMILVSKTWGEQFGDRILRQIIKELELILLAPVDTSSSDHSRSVKRRKKRQPSAGLVKSAEGICKVLWEDEDLRERWGKDLQALDYLC